MFRTSRRNSRSVIKKKTIKFCSCWRGFSGVETIGELKEMIDRLIKYYRNINKNEIKFHLIEYASRLLPELEKKLVFTH